MTTASFIGFVITIYFFLTGFVRRDVDVVYVEKVCSCGNKNWQDAIDVLLSDF